MKWLYYFPLFMSLLFAGKVYAQSPSSLQKLDSLVTLEHKNANFKQAIEYAEKALEEAATLYTKNDTNYTIHLRQLGKMVQLVGEYDQAEKLFMESYTTDQKILPDNHYLLAENQNFLAGFYFRNGNIKKQEFYQRAHHDWVVKNSPPNSIKVAESLLNMGNLYRRLEQTDNALNFVEQALEIAKNGDDEYMLAGCYLNLASVYKEVGRFKETIPLYNEAAILVKKTWGGEHPNYGRVLNNSAIAYKNLGQYNEAEKRYKEALRIRRNTLGENHYRVATVMRNLSTLYLQQEKFVEAQSYAEQSARVNSIAFGGKHSRVAMSYVTLMQIARMQKDYVTIPTYLYKALNANSYEDIDSTQSIRTIVERNDFQSYGLVLATLRELTRYYDDAYKKFDKLSDLKMTYDIKQTAIWFIKKTERGLSSTKDKLRLLGQSNGWIGTTIKTAYLLHEKTGEKQYLEAILQLSESNKSAVLFSNINTENALSMGGVPDELIKQKKAIDEAIANNLKALLEAKNNGDSTLIAQERALLVQNNYRKDSLATVLENQYSKYKSLKEQVIETDLIGLQEKVVDKETALIEYFIRDTTVYSSVLTQDNIICYPITFRKGELKESVKKLRKGLSNYQFIFNNKDEAASLYKEYAHLLYQKLIQPLEEELADIKNLIIVSDGILGHIPFEALLTERQGQSKTVDWKGMPYLIHRYNISYSYAAFLLLQNLEKKNENNGQLIAFAASYGSTDAYSDYRTEEKQIMRSSLTELKAVKEEVKSLETLFGKGAFVYDNEANEAAFKQKSSDYAVIHLAMHGLLNEKAPLLSSLAFTENGDTLEDNFLEASEIALLDLKSDLVVLSACETGYGKFQQGEGVMSLARSFMYAGTPSLIVSLWQVNDNSTAIIMKLFYQNILEGMPKDQALSVAKLAYIERAEGIVLHPAFWSAFIQLGDRSPINIQVYQPWYFRWYFWVGFILVITIAGYRRKATLKV